MEGSGEMAIMPKLKRRICWITPAYFLDVDAYIVPQLSNSYEIDWILINIRDSRLNSEGFTFDGLIPRQFYLRYRQRDPRVILQYLGLLREIRKSEYDLIYISFHGLPYFFPFFCSFIDPKKVIYGAHNVSTPKGASNQRLMRIYQAYIFKRISNFHVFSRYQLATIQKLLPRKHHYYAPLALKDYGSSEVSPPDDVIRFLFFGYIRDYKRLDILIHAFQDLCDSGIRNIELHIAGNCNDWAHYQSMITADDRIRTRIEIIPNKDVPDLISSCHYMVLPYQDGAQSGVLALAYQYNKPVIASDIPAFKEFIEDGLTGFFFKSESWASLADAMRHVAADHSANYGRLQTNVKAFVKKEYSIHQILARYEAFIEECIARNDQ